MHYFEIEMLVHERMGRDLGTLLLSFLKEAPTPWCWPIAPQPSPWDPLLSAASDGIELPLFAP